MFAFAGALSIPRAHTRTRAQCATRKRVLACAVGGNGVAPDSTSGADAHHEAAIGSAALLRQRLAQVTEERRKNAERVNKSIEEMNAALDSIMDKLRGDTPAPAKREEAATETPLQTVEPATAENEPAASNNALDDDSEPYMDPSMYGLEATAGWQVLANSDALPSSDSALKFRIECDGNGCSIIEMDADAAPGPGVRQQYVHAGRGYRVGYDPEAPHSFCGMVGTEQWLLALDKQETKHFKRLVTAVARKMARIDRGDEQAPGPKATAAVRRSGDGMFNERVASTDGARCSVELESKLMWVQATGKPRLGAYDLRVIFMERRQIEGYWPPDVVPGLLVAVARLGVD